MLRLFIVAIWQIWPTYFFILGIIEFLGKFSNLNLILENFLVSRTLSMFLFHFKASLRFILFLDSFLHQLTIFVAHKSKLFIIVRLNEWEPRQRYTKLGFQAGQDW